MWRSTEPAAIIWEPSAYKDTAGDRVNVCLEATEEALAAVESWEAAEPGGWPADVVDGQLLVAPGAPLNCASTVVPSLSTILVLTSPAAMRR